MIFRIDLVFMRRVFIDLRVNDLINKFLIAVGADRPGFSWKTIVLLS